MHRALCKGLSKYVRGPRQEPRAKGHISNYLYIYWGSGPHGPRHRGSIATLQIHGNLQDQKSLGLGLMYDCTDSSANSINTVLLPFSSNRFWSLDYPKLSLSHLQPLNTHSLILQCSHWHLLQHIGDNSNVSRSQCWGLTCGFGDIIQEFVSIH